MRESFVIHSEYIEDLPEESKAEFLVYIYNYGAKGIEPELDGFAKTVWIKIKRRIDTDIEQYENTINARSAAGKKHKGNQYTKELEQNGTNGTKFQNVEQNGTNGTVYESVNDFDFDTDTDTVNTLSACEPQKIGALQKELYQIVTEHNKTAAKNKKIPVSNSFFAFTTKESRELLETVGIKEPPDRIKQALLNFIAVAKSDTWRRFFTWTSFCKNYTEFTPEYFSLEKYLEKSKGAKSDSFVITGEMKF